MTVAALFVEKGGVYWDLEGVDPWDEKRDARLYPGPHPVVAHPPCERFGRNASKGGRIVGADDGCFEAALVALFDFGGVLEHPADSKAWSMYGLQAPPRRGGWIDAGRGNLVTCCVEQGHFGHQARKATWLLANVPMLSALPSLPWGPGPFVPPRKMREAVTEEQRIRARRTGVVQNLSAKQRRATPIAFRDLLLSIARSATRQELQP